MFVGLEMSESVFRIAHTQNGKEARIHSDGYSAADGLSECARANGVPSKRKVVRRTGQAISDAEASTSRRRSLKMQREQMESDRKRKSKAR